MVDVKVLIIDSDPEFCQKVAQLFGQSGADVKIETSGQQGLMQFYEWRPDLVILDISMAQSDDWEVCGLLCSISDSPVIILSSIRDDDMLVRALDMGAADFLTKPFNLDILPARARAALRNTNNNHAGQHSWSYQDSRIGIDLGRRRVLVDGKPVGLTKTEYRLLAYLLRNAGQVLSIDRILENVWGTGYRDSSASVHVYISRLRKKLEADPQRPRYLQTEYGLGYRFETRKNGNAH